MKHDAFMGDLQESCRPGILVGGGAYRARDKIAEFALKYSVPVFRTWNALDVMPDHCYAFGGTVGTYGGIGRNFGIQNCDLLLILGCRISGRITGGNPQTFARGAKRYWVDLDADLLAEHEVPPAHAICGDVGEFVEKCLNGQYQSWTLEFKSWLERCHEWVTLHDPVKPEHLTAWHHYGFMRELSERIPENAIVTYDTGGNAIMMGQCFKSKRGQRIFSSNGNTPMGFSMCGAIGAWFAEPNRPIICIIGDGGMQLNIQELQTIQHYKIPLKVFIINNGVLGNTKAYQRVNGKPEIACGPDGYSAPNFSAVARAYGLPASVIQGLDDFFLVRGALNSPGACIVDVQDFDRCSYEPRVSRWDTPIEDMQPFLSREEFRAQMVVEPVKGWESNV